MLDSVVISPFLVRIGGRIVRTVVVSLGWWPSLVEWSLSSICCGVSRWSLAVWMCGRCLESSRRE